MIAVPADSDLLVSPSHHDSAYSLARNPIKEEILKQITTKLNMNCCLNLYYQIKRREDTVCVENTGLPCPDQAARDADIIVEYYQKRTECCRRLEIARCAGAGSK